MKILLGLTTINKTMNLKIDRNTHEAWLNNQPFELDIDNFSRKILRIISSWEEKMINKKTLDGISYFVYVQMDDGKKYKYDGKNKFPKNFDEFIKALSETKIW